MTSLDRSVLRRVKLFDRIARVIITAGGVLVIGSVIAIVLLILSVTFPLFRGSDARLRVSAALPAEVPGADVLSLGVDLVELDAGPQGDSLTAYTLTRDGTFTALEFVGPTDKPEKRRTPTDYYPLVLSRRKLDPPSAASGQTVERVERSGGSRFTLLWSDGGVSVVEATAHPKFDELGRRQVEYGFQTRASLPAEEDAEALRAVAAVAEDGAVTCAKLLADNRLVIVRESVEKTLLGTGRKKTNRRVIDVGIPGKITAVTLTRDGDTLYAGTENGHLVRWMIGRKGTARRRQVVSVPGGTAVTSLGMVFGEVSLAVGDADGNVSTWFPVQTQDGKKLRLIHPLSRHAAAVREILPSQRNKTLMSLSETGVAMLDYATSEKRLATLEGDRPLRTAGYSPRGNAVIGLGEDDRLLVWQIDSPHPEVTWGTLFGKVWYENHDEPKYMWQSSGTDEPKLSLVPVIFGTLKATIYAMLFAVPLALLSALYVSHFTTPEFKRFIKPIVEVMAAVPTVVVGFLILLWAAPLVGKWIVGVFVALLTVPVTFVVFMVLWQWLRRYDWAKWLENGYEFLVLVPVILLGVGIGMALAVPLENALFSGDFQQWLFDSTGQRYLPLNSLVVAFGLGFAVIPIIFSISEDSLSDIPHSLSAASLALGASRWQTAWRVILPSASPGIFAATMIGFGRAVGETMIVFMATGNTPILDWSPFNGFRTLSANIAVEISEAAQGGTLYRILFLCAVILFLLTFLLNTAAELVRSRLRKKYGRY